MLKSNFAKISIIFAAIAVLVVGVAIPVSADTTTTTATTTSAPALHTVQGVVNTVNSTSGSFTVGSYISCCFNRFQYKILPDPSW